MEEKYQVGHSPDTLFPNSPTGLMLRQDLSLRLPQMTGNVGTISGKVYYKKADGQLEGLPNAIVVLLSNTYAPRYYTITDDNGGYSFPAVEAGQYFVYAAKEEYKTSSYEQLILSEREKKNKDFTLNTDDNWKYSIVTGRVITPMGDGLEMARVVLKKEENVISEAYTNVYGQFLFEKVHEGEYDLCVTRKNYVENPPERIRIVGSHRMVDKLITLLVDPKAKLYVLEGRIFDNWTNNPVPEATVVLFRKSSDQDTHGTPVRFTYTGPSGNYVFYQDIQPGQRYYVKSNQIIYQVTA